MSELDALKESIAYLKVWLGIFVVTDISLIGWLASNFNEATIPMRVSNILAIIAVSVLTWAFHRKIEIQIQRVREL